MYIHTIAYFIAITILFTSTIYSLITNQTIFGLTSKQEHILLLVATLLVAYDYSYTHGYIKF